MAGETVFDKLVSSLSREERREMLERIQRTVSVETPPPVAPEQDGAGPVDVDEAYRRLPLLRKLLILLERVFTGKTREELVHALLLRQLAASIRSTYPGLVDFRAATMTNATYDHLVKLRNSAQFFAGPVGRAGGRERPVFLAFLLALEAPDVQEVLEHSVDPYRVEEDGGTDTQVRHYMVEAVEHAFDGLSDTVRQRMRQGNRFLDVMGGLAFFPFEKLLQPFRHVSDELGVQASFLNLRDVFPDLVAPMEALDVSPSTACLEALILFHQGYEFTDTVDDAVLGERLKKAAGHLSAIRTVAGKVPFRDVSRYLLGDINYSPEPLHGGEEWLAVVRRFWRSRAEEAYRTYRYHRRKDDIIHEAVDLTGTSEIKPISGYPALSEDDGGTHALSLALLKAILDKAWQQQVFPTLKQLFIEGEFYKEENRAEFSDAYSTISRLPEKIDGFKTRISMQGDLGRALHDLEQESFALPEKKRRRSEIIAQIDEHAESLVKSAMRSLDALNKVLYGVLHGEVGGQYDTLSNLQEIGGRHNRSYLEALDRALMTCQAAGTAMGKLFDLERAQISAGGYEAAGVRAQ